VSAGAGSAGRARARRREPHGASVSRALGAPRQVRVRAGAEGVPETVDGRRIEAVRESWLIEDRWWTGRPLRRRYWEVLSAAGRNLVVFHDLVDGEWFVQAG
jgi:hypothetical protein